MPPQDGAAHRNEKFAHVFLSHQTELSVADELAQVDEGIAHTAKRRVDADACQLSNLLEAKVVVETHHDDFLLRLWQVVEQMAYRLTRLTVDHLILARSFAQAQTVQSLGLHLVLADGLCRLAFAALVNNEVMRDACEPGAELSARLILVAADGNDGTLERVLEEVVGCIAVLYQKKNVGIDIRLMPLEQNIERTIIAVFIQYDQLMVGHCRQIIHYVSNFGFGVMSFYRQSVLVRFIAV